MSLLILPQGLPGTRTKEPLSREEIDLLHKFEAWLDRRGLSMTLVCDTCVRNEDYKNCRCQGDNERDATAYKITCGHCERVYGADLAH